MSIIRHRQILERLESGEEISVGILAQELGTSEITIRRDLTQLAEQGKLIRTHGGALKADASFVPFQQKITIHTQAKREIGERAAALVEENDTILLDCGSTVLAMCPYLKRFKHLKIITNSLPVVWELADAPHLAINLVGGELDQARKAVHGSMALEHIGRYHAHKAFVGVDGLSLKNGLTAQSEKEASLTTAMIAHAAKTFLLADHGKFEQDSYLKFAPLSTIDRIITDAGLDHSVSEAYEKAGIRIMK